MMTPSCRRSARSLPVSFLFAALSCSWPGKTRPAHCRNTHLFSASHTQTLPSGRSLTATRSTRDTNRTFVRQNIKQISDRLQVVSLILWLYNIHFITKCIFVSTVTTKSASIHDFDTIVISARRKYSPRDTQKYFDGRAKLSALDDGSPDNSVQLLIA